MTDPATTTPADARAIDRAMLLAAARAWWAARMPDSHVTNIVITGDGRVNVSWSDRDEDGRYTLPVTYLQEVAALTAEIAEGAVDDPLRLALEPFAAAAALYAWPVYERDDHAIGIGSLTVRHLRAARDALAPATPVGAIAEGRECAPPEQGAAS